MTEIVIVSVIVGVFIGVFAAFALRIFDGKNTKTIAQELLAENENRKKAEDDALFSNLKDSFGKISFESLSKANEEFFKIAKQRFDSEREINVKDLEGKKTLIDGHIQTMNEELGKVSNLMRALEKDREGKFGELANNLKTTNEQMASLTKSTASLHELLSNTRMRGQWGERMAEDVLRVAGLQENINYTKQTSTDSNSRPDFTFNLPKDLKLNMDVKFPFNNYMNYVNSEDHPVKYKKEFLKDVKNRVKEITTKDYINVEQNTVQFVLLFIPNEQIYEFINREDPEIMDYALKNSVIVCSPFTLFAVLAVVKEATDNFAFQKASDEILGLLGKFKKEWEKFSEKLNGLGSKISAVDKEYTTIVTTRKKALEKPLNKIDDIRIHRGILSDEADKKNEG